MRGNSESNTFNKIETPHVYISDLFIYFLMMMMMMTGVQKCNAVERVREQLRVRV